MILLSLLVAAAVGNVIPKGETSEDPISEGDESGSGAVVEGDVFIPSLSPRLRDSQGV